MTLYRSELRSSANSKPSSSENAYKKYIILGIEESNSFRNLYEFNNVRTYSEAMCETIGSMMSIEVPNDRNLQPFNLDKELYIRFNQPRLHKIHDFVKFVARSWREIGNKEFFIKKRRATRRLNLSTLSSSLSNFHSTEEVKAHFPVTL